MKILIIDDEAKIARILQVNLKASGYDVAVAHTGEDGLKITTSFKPDVILLDLKLPGISGWEVLEKIKTSPKTKIIRIIIIAASTLPEYAQRAMANGAEAFIAKPFQIEDILQQIGDR